MADAIIGGNAPFPKAPKTMRRADVLARDYLDALENRYNGSHRHRPSGFSTLDRQSPGWLHEGHLIVLAGRPAMGKSALAQQIAENVAQGGATALLYTLEMSGYEITERAVSRRTAIPIPRLKTTDLSDQDFGRIAEAMTIFGQLPLLVDDASFDIAGMVHKTKSVAAVLASQGLPPLGVVVVDYLQLVGGKAAANRTLEIGQVTGALKRLAKELAVPVLALSQLNRGVESRQNKRPTLADLRESGNIEQDSDLVMFVYRDDYYNEDSPDKGTAEVIISKNRHGATGTARLAFVGDRVLFGDLAHE